MLRPAFASRFPWKSFHARRWTSVVRVFDALNWTDTESAGELAPSIASARGVPDEVPSGATSATPIAVTARSPTATLCFRVDRRSPIENPLGAAVGDIIAQNFEAPVRHETRRWAATGRNP